MAEEKVKKNPLFCHRKTARLIFSVIEEEQHPVIQSG